MISTVGSVELAVQKFGRDGRFCRCLRIESRMVMGCARNSYLTDFRSNMVHGQASLAIYNGRDWWRGGGKDQELPIYTFFKIMAVWFLTFAKHFVCYKREFGIRIFNLRPIQRI